LLSNYNESERKLLEYKSATLNKIENNKDEIDEQLIAVNTYASELSENMIRMTSETAKNAFDQLRITE